MLFLRLIFAFDIEPANSELLLIAPTYTPPNGKEFVSSMPLWFLYKSYTLIYETIAKRNCEIPYKDELRKVVDIDKYLRLVHKEIQNAVEGYMTRYLDDEIEDETNSVKRVINAILTSQNDFIDSDGYRNLLSIKIQTGKGPKAEKIMAVAFADAFYTCITHYIINQINEISQNQNEIARTCHDVLFQILKDSYYLFWHFSYGFKSGDAPLSLNYKSPLMYKKSKSITEDVSDLYRKIDEKSKENPDLPIHGWIITDLSLYIIEYFACHGSDINNDPSFFSQEKSFIPDFMNFLYINKQRIPKINISHTQNSGHVFWLNMIHSCKDIGKLLSFTAIDCKYIEKCYTSGLVLNLIAIRHNSLLSSTIAIRGNLAIRRQARTFISLEDRVININSRIEGEKNKTAEFQIHSFDVMIGKNKSVRVVYANDIDTGKYETKIEKILHSCNSFQKHEVDQKKLKRLSELCGFIETINIERESLRKKTGKKKRRYNPQKLDINIVYVEEDNDLSNETDQKGIKHDPNNYYALIGLEEADINDSLEKETVKTPNRNHQYLGENKRVPDQKYQARYDQGQEKHTYKRNRGCKSGIFFQNPKIDQSEIDTIAKNQYEMKTLFIKPIKVSIRSQGFSIIKASVIRIQPKNIKKFIKMRIHLRQRIR